MSDTPAIGSRTAVAQFLERKRAIDTYVSRNPRLIFAIDATASRQPTWDLACSLQSRMFSATQQIASLSVQLVYYRGLSECRASRWLGDTEALAQSMRRVFCEAGQTQIERILRHALSEQRKAPVRALVFIGDAMEENPTRLRELAGQCGLLKLPLFLFQEGSDPTVTAVFEDLARLSGGASCRFDQASAHTLAELLGAVARYAAGGRAALENKRGEGARLLLAQLKP